MTGCALWCSSGAGPLRGVATVVFGLYATSVLAGAVAHQTFLTVAARNTLEFRLVWNLCVGTVAAAGGAIGICGTKIVRMLHSADDGDYHVRVPALHPSFWITYGVYMTVQCFVGGLSYQRPACDIFIAGCTQFVPTAYCVAAVAARKVSILPLPPDPRVYVTRHVFGFFLNAILLPAYPVLVQYSGWTLGAVNAVLHTNLLVAWTTQAVSLRYIGGSYAGKTA